MSLDLKRIDRSAPLAQVGNRAQTLTVKNKYQNWTKIKGYLGLFESCSAKPDSLKRKSVFSTMVKCSVLILAGLIIVPLLIPVDAFMCGVNIFRNALENRSIDAFPSSPSYDAAWKSAFGGMASRESSSDGGHIIDLSDLIIPE